MRTKPSHERPSRHPLAEVSRLSLALLLTLPLLLGLGCGSVAVWAAPDKKAQPETSAAARAANQAFWEAFHAGHYQAIPEVLDKLEAVYLANPRDPETTAHIGFAHTWRLAESARQERLSPTITDDIVVGHKYFAEAVRLEPRDVRYQGFLASLELAEGSVHGDEKLTRRGYYDLLAASDAWPEFNLFTAGYALGRLPYTDAKFADAVEYQWRTLDLCANEKVDRHDLDYGRFMALETTQGKQRVCWNSWIAPHNFEGFFLNMGDMLVKQGDVAAARRVYAQARHSRTYDAWAFKDLLDERIRDAEANVNVFRNPARGEPRRTPMATSAFACGACHQN
jgi:hypothetical protein